MYPAAFNAHLKALRFIELKKPATVGLTYRSGQKKVRQIELSHKEFYLSEAY